MDSSRNLKITVIEDNETMAEMTKDFLLDKFSGSQVSVYPTGEKALAEITASPDLFILDYQLDSQNPKALNGIQILMKLKKQFKSPVIFLSGQDRLDVAANTMKYGASDYVIKNKESFHRLEISIGNVLKQASMNKSMSSQKKWIVTLALLNILLIGVILWMRFS